MINMGTIKKHCFPKKDCSECKKHRALREERDRLTRDIKFLNTVGLASPIAQEKLEQVTGHIRDCLRGDCQGGE